MPDNTLRARDEAFWRTFADRYEVQPGPINLENGYFGRMSRTVVEEYQRNIELINRSNSVYVRQRFEQGESQKISSQVAGLIGVAAESVALTRNATDGLQALIRNYNRLQPGEQVLFSDLEYDTVKGADLGSDEGRLVIDFNFAYNPSCAYDPAWACPLAPKSSRATLSGPVPTWPRSGGGKPSRSGRPWWSSSSFTGAGCAARARTRAWPGSPTGCPR